MYIYVYIYIYIYYVYVCICKLCIYIYILYYTILQVTNNNNIPLHCVSWGLPNLQMVYICVIPKTKQTYIYKQYHKNNILSVLKTLQSKLIHVAAL